MANAARVLQEALALTAEERAHLAHELISSLDGDDPDATVAWSDEIRKRIDGVEAGTAELETWETVRARLQSAASR